MPAYPLRNFHLYLHTPAVAMKARLNMPGTITYPVSTLIFDGVTEGAFTSVYTDMTVLLGSADGLDDYGRVRVQNVATSTTIPIGRTSQGVEDGTVTIVDNAYITCLVDFRVWSRIPYETADGLVYKDSDYSVSDFMTEIPPVSNCGPGFADYIDPDTSVITVTFPMFGNDASYAMADGAVIATYIWDIGDGTVTDGDIDEATLTATFPAGFRYVALTVIDDNGKAHTSRCPVLAVDPDDDVTIPFTDVRHRIGMAGQEFEFRIVEDLSRLTFPDGGLVMFWADEATDPEQRDHMRFVGWHQSDSVEIRTTPEGVIRETVLRCLDVAGRLDTLPAFPQALERRDDEEYWAYMPTLTLRKAIHYLGYWYSTAFALADLVLPDALEDYPAMRLDSLGSSLYDQINSRAQSAVPDYFLNCDTLGRLVVHSDWMLLDFNDRPDATGRNITEDEWSDLQVVYTRPPKIYALRTSAVVASTSWLVLGGQNTLPLAFCIAPGPAFGQGLSEQIVGEKLTISQATLNACEGHRYARYNARYGTFTLTLPTDDISDYEPASMLPVELQISATTAAQRGLDSTELRGLVKSIEMVYHITPNGTWVQPRLVFEREVEGAPAVTVIPELAETPDDIEIPDPPPGTIVPDFGLREGQEKVAGIGADGYIYRTSDFQTVSGSGGPTWDRVDTTIADTIYSFVVDPFSPGYAPGATSGAINGWIANDTDIYRVTDLFGSVAATSVYTFDEATVGASFHWRTIQASFGAYFAEGANPWLLCISYYGDTAGHTGTWATYSTDGGATWATEVPVSEFYDTTLAPSFKPIAVYTSPKTPGLAYTAAYTETGLAPLADGYVSTDWGATWTRVSSAPALDGANPSVQWALWNVAPATSPPTEILGPAASRAVAAIASDVTPSGVVTRTFDLIVAPHPDTAEITYEGSWAASRSHTGASSSTSVNINKMADAGNGDATDTMSYSGPSDPGATDGTFTGTITKTNSSDWTTNSGNVAAVSSAGVGNRARCSASANAFGVGNVALGTTEYRIRILTIEMEDSTLFVPSDYGPGFIQPGRAFGGTIHLPWPTNADETLAYFGYYERFVNREFRLKQSVAGTITDISPTDSGVSFGPSRGPFGVRSYDQNRQYMAIAGRGNDTSGDVADDLVGLWVSIDSGASWTNILAPAAVSNVLNGLEIAFSGTTPNTIFSWGGISSGSLAAIYYSSDFGSTLDSRQGNLESSFGGVVFLGIAGGVG